MTMTDTDTGETISPELLETVARAMHEWRGAAHEPGGGYNPGGPCSYCRELARVALTTAIYPPVPTDRPTYLEAVTAAEVLRYLDRAAAVSLDPAFDAWAPELARLAVSTVIAAMRHGSALRDEIEAARLGGIGLDAALDVAETWAAP